MKRFRKWLSAKLFKLSFWVLPFDKTKDRSIEIDKLVLKITKSNKFTKLLSMATETHSHATGARISSKKPGFHDSEANLEIIRHERALALKKNIKKVDESED